MKQSNIGLAAVATVAIAVVLLFSWSVQDEPPSAEGFVTCLDSGDYEGAYRMLSGPAREAIGSPEALGADYTATVSALEAALGPYAGLTDVTGTVPYQGGDMDYVVAAFAYSGVMMAVATDGDGMVQGLTTLACDLPSEADVPEDVTEVPVEVVTGDRMPLRGMLSYGDVSDRRVAVVLVPGSGSHGMNCAIGGNQIFQQIAWGLNSHGVDVLRYDQRTYTDPFGVDLGTAPFDIGYEVVDDAISAGRLLRDMGYERVYLVGHSQGAMMAPSIVAESDGVFDGLVSMAGSPRDISQIQYDQNMDLISQVPPGPERDIMQQMVDAEYAKYLGIRDIPESEIHSVQVFGLPAYYVLSMMDRDNAGAALASDLPMLFI